MQACFLLNNHNSSYFCSQILIQKFNLYLTEYTFKSHIFLLTPLNINISINELILLKELKYCFSTTTVKIKRPGELKLSKCQLGVKYKGYISLWQSFNNSYYSITITSNFFGHFFERVKKIYLII